MCWEQQSWQRPECTEYGADWQWCPPRRRRKARGACAPRPAVRTLLIAYFPREACETIIYQAFARYGTVEDVNLIWDINAQRPRCYGFVRFADADGARRGLQATQNHQIQLLDSRGHAWSVKGEWARDAAAAGESDDEDGHDGSGMPHTSVWHSGNANVIEQRRALGMRCQIQRGA